MSMQVTDDNPVLKNLIVQQILDSPDQRITFAKYMELVLYHPQQGYYITRATKIGAAGDFYTAPHLGADFGELLAEQFYQMWQLLNHPDHFTLVEMGAGQGILAGDVLRYLHDRYPDCFQGLNYIIVEQSSSLRTAQQQQLQDWSCIQWQDLESIPLNSVTGCFFSNELVDAFPVHLVTLEDGQLREIYVQVTPDQSEFIETVGDLSTDKLAAYFPANGIQLVPPTYTDGYRTEINLAALDWLATIAERLQRGYILTIDYGYRAAQYYSPTRREGTLQCYYQHTHHSNPYIHIGHQDLTAHVDFTALEKWGELWGLQPIGLTQQGLFLMALGIGDRMAALTQENGLSLSDALRRREALHSLINPMGLGNFQVLIQSKGLSPKRMLMPLKGLQQG